MRIAFLGTAEFGIPTLKTLLDSRHEVVGVVTGADKPTGRGRKLQSTPVKVFAEQARLPILTPEKLKNPQFLEQFAAWKPDIAVVVAYRILPPEVFDLPKHGTLNLHPSLLPAFRGPAPIQWALINGEGETGVSVIRISSKVDAGGILLQFIERINPFDTAGDLMERLSITGAQMIRQTVEKLESGSLDVLPQDESRVTKAPKLTKEDGRIDWTQPAFIIHNRVRGVTPSPGAFTTQNGDIIKLFDSRLGRGSGKPGEILEVEEKLVVGTGNGAVSFGQIQRQGKKRMDIKSYLLGAKLPVGEFLGT
ncbi:methionyl-tRNA formyltransferase [bacterium]|nr:methionyl-tRNA formyltransferase [bacterium]